MKNILLQEQSFRHEIDIFKKIAQELGVNLAVVDPICSAPIKKAYDATLVRTYRGFEAINTFIKSLPGKPAVFGFDPKDTIQLLNKYEDMLLLEKSGVRVPKSTLTLEGHKEVWVRKSFWGFGGQGVSLREDRLLEDGYFAQEYLDEEVQDYRVYDGCDFVVCRNPAEGDFRTNKYQGGESVVLSKKEFIEQRGEKLYFDIMSQSAFAIDVLHRRFGATDIKVQTGLAYVLEVNRTPRLRIEQEWAEVVVKTWFEEIIKSFI